LRVLLVSNGFPPEGQWGTEFYTHQAAVGLAERGHIVRVFCPRREGEGERFSIHRSVRYGVGVHEVFHPPSRTKRFHESFLCQQVEERFEQTLRELRPEVVHFTHFLWGLSSRLPRIARDAGARVVVTLTDFGILCHRGQLLDAVLDPCSGPAPDKCARCVRSLGPYDGHPLARAVRETLATALAAVGGAGLVPTPGHLREREAAIADALDAAQLFIAPTQALADRLPAEVVPPDRLRVLCYGLDERRFQRQPEPDRSGPLRFGFLGQFQPHKGLDTLFRAVEILEGRAISTLRDWRVRVHGNPVGGRHGRYLGATWDPRLAPRFEFAGAFEPLDAPREMAELDILLVPSKWTENAPLTVLQAQAMGLPVLASDVPGIREIEGEGMTLLDPHDPGAWAYEMGERISAGPGRLPAGQDLPVTLGEHLGQLEAWYDDLLDERRLRLVGGA
jgi:glycosyltransferase involved in cell wall biosynthesis